MEHYHVGVSLTLISPLHPASPEPPSLTPVYIPPFRPLQLVFLSSPSIIWSFPPPPLSLSFALSAKFDPSFSFHSTFSLFLVFPLEKGLALPPWRLQGSPPPPHLSLPPFFSSPFSLHSTVSSESGTDRISIESPRRPTPSPFPPLLSPLMAFCCVFFGFMFCLLYLLPVWLPHPATIKLSRWS